MGQRCEVFEWITEQPIKAVLEDAIDTLAKSVLEGILRLVMKLHAGMATAKFHDHDITKQWLGTARHPRFDRRYNELVFQPMLELLAYLRRQRLQDVYHLRSYTHRRAIAPKDNTD